MGKTKFYVVFVGRKPGIYMSWHECYRQVNEFRGALQRSYETVEEAEYAYIQFRLSTVDQSLTVPPSEVGRHTSPISENEGRQLNNTQYLILGFIIGMVVMYVGISLLELK